MRQPRRDMRDATCDMRDATCDNRDATCETRYSRRDIRDAIFEMGYLRWGKEDIELWKLKEGKLLWSERDFMYSCHLFSVQDSRRKLLTAYHVGDGVESFQICEAYFIFDGKEEIIAFSLCHNFISIVLTGTEVIKPEHFLVGVNIDSFS